MKKLIIAASLLLVGVIAGCGGGGGSISVADTTISGRVGDGYLSGAEVFLDKHGTFQWDGVEPRTMTDSTGAFSMMVSATDAANFPVVVRVIGGSTVETDTHAAAAGSYIMRAPVGMAGFISPISTLIMEKMFANPTMTFSEAVAQLRSQMGMTSDIDMMADYVAGSMSGSNTLQYQMIRANAQKMAALMAGSGSMVMTGSSVNVTRYHAMTSIINNNMSSIASNMMGSTFMTSLMSQMQSQLGSMPMSSAFLNYSTTGNTSGSMGSGMMR